MRTAWEVGDGEGGGRSLPEANPPFVSTQRLEKTSTLRPLQTRSLAAKLGNVLRTPSLLSHSDWSPNPLFCRTVTGLPTPSLLSHSDWSPNPLFCHTVTGLPTLSSVTLLLVSQLSLLSHSDWSPNSLFCHTVTVSQPSLLSHKLVSPHPLFCHTVTGLPILSSVTQ